MRAITVLFKDVGVSHKFISHSLCRRSVFLDSPSVGKPVQACSYSQISLSLRVSSSTLNQHMSVISHPLGEPSLSAHISAKQVHHLSPFQLSVPHHERNACQQTLPPSVTPSPHTLGIWSHTCSQSFYLCKSQNSVALWNVVEDPATG